MMNSVQHFDVRRATALGGAVGAIGETRAIPLLLGKLTNTRVSSTWSFNNVKLTIAASDPALLALLMLTHQSPAAYGLISHEQRSSSSQSHVIYGFGDKKARDKAIAKFVDWWAKHKGKAPYKNLQPLHLPDLSVPGPSGQRQVQERT